jgi:kynurenine formamidase
VEESNFAGHEASVYEFCFVCLPLSIRGATGSMVRRVALV